MMVLMVMMTVVTGVFMESGSNEGLQKQVRSLLTLLNAFNQNISLTHIHKLLLETTNILSQGNISNSNCCLYQAHAKYKYQRETHFTIYQL